MDKAMHGSLGAAPDKRMLPHGAAGSTCCSRELPRSRMRRCACRAHPMLLGNAVMEPPCVAHAAPDSRHPPHLEPQARAVAVQLAVKGAQVLVQLPDVAVDKVVDLRRDAHLFVCVGGVPSAHAGVGAGAWAACMGAARAGCCQRAPHNTV